MKIIISILVILALLISMCGCDKNSEHNFFINAVDIEDEYINGKIQKGKLIVDVDAEVTSKQNKLNTYSVEIKAINNDTLSTLASIIFEMPLSDLQLTDNGAMMTYYADAQILNIYDNGYIEYKEWNDKHINNEEEFYNFYGEFIKNSNNYFDFNFKDTDIIDTEETISIESIRNMDMIDIHNQDINTYDGISFLSEKTNFSFNKNDKKASFIIIQYNYKTEKSVSEIIDVKSAMYTFTNEGIFLLGSYLTRGYSATITSIDVCYSYNISRSTGQITLVPCWRFKCILKKSNEDEIVRYVLVNAITNKLIV